jgi:hypothetical protein
MLVTGCWILVTGYWLLEKGVASGRRSHWLIWAHSKIASHFFMLMHPTWLRCEILEYPDIPAFSRLA